MEMVKTKKSKIVWEVLLSTWQFVLYTDIEDMHSLHIGPTTEPELTHCMCHFIPIHLSNSQIQNGCWLKHLFYAFS